MTANMRSRLIALLGEGGDAFDCVPMQGSGTFAVEAMLSSFIPKDGKALVLAIGAYGQRASADARLSGSCPCGCSTRATIFHPVVPRLRPFWPTIPPITHVVAIHCETSSGILNPIEEIAEATSAAGRKLLVDSMSAFGALPLPPSQITYEAMVSSANKCIEGVPGFGFILARKTALDEAGCNCPSLSLDVHAQWSHMNKSGQWRFTPPTHAVAAFLAALDAH